MEPTSIRLAGCMRPQRTPPAQPILQEMGLNGRTRKARNRSWTMRQIGKFPSAVHWLHAVIVIVRTSLELLPLG